MLCWTRKPAETVGLLFVWKKGKQKIRTINRRSLEQLPLSESETGLFVDGRGSQCHRSRVEKVTDDVCDHDSDLVRAGVGFFPVLLTQTILALGFSRSLCLGLVALEHQIKCSLELPGSRLMNDAAGPTVERVDEQHWNEVFAFIYVDRAHVVGLNESLVRKVQAVGEFGYAGG